MNFSGQLLSLCCRIISCWSLTRDGNDYAIALAAFHGEDDLPVADLSDGSPVELDGFPGGPLQHTQRPHRTELLGNRIPNGLGASHQDQSQPWTSPSCVIAGPQGAPSGLLTENQP